MSTPPLTPSTPWSPPPAVTPPAVTPPAVTPPAVTPLPLSALRLDGGTQLRLELNPATLREYAAALSSGAAFPPVIAYWDGSGYWLADGFHRVEARREAGFTHVSVEVRSGSRRDAVLHAAGANATHGLRRTQADKRRAVLTLLRDPEWSAWSDREIARRCGVHHDLVGRLRGELSGGFRQMERRVRRGTGEYLQRVPVSRPRQGTNGSFDSAKALEKPGCEQPVSTNQFGDEALRNQAEAQPVPASPSVLVTPPEPAVEAGPPPALNGENVAASGGSLAARLRHALAVTDRATSAPEPAAERPSVQHGDWWSLGHHRLYCGRPEDPAFRLHAGGAGLALVLWPGAGDPLRLASLAPAAETLVVLAEAEQYADLVRSHSLPCEASVAVDLRQASRCPRWGKADWRVLCRFGMGPVAPPLNSRAPDLNTRTSVLLPGEPGTLEETLADCLPWLLAHWGAPGVRVLAAGAAVVAALLAAEELGHPLVGVAPAPQLIGRALQAWEGWTGRRARLEPRRR